MKAYAKVNLTLEVLGKESDGFHRICSIMQTINLHDNITFKDDDSVSLLCDDPALMNNDNLIIKAATLLRSEYGVKSGAGIELQKAIPRAAGLGGGSSDAAATLIALNQLWKLNLQQNELDKIAGEIGSDVAFFIRGGTALAAGRGEIITPLPPLKPCRLVLLILPYEIENKTKKMYALLRKQHYSKGKFTSQMAEIIRNEDDITTSLLYNVFDDVAEKLFTHIADYKDVFCQAGAEKVILCGAGPTLMTVAKNESQAYLIRNKLHNSGLEAKVASIVSGIGE